MKFTELEIKAAYLLATGVMEVEVAETVGKSRSWVQRLKKKKGFKELIDTNKIEKRIEDKLDEVKPVFIKKVLAEIVEDELELTKQKLGEIYLETAREIYKMSENLRIKLKEHIENIEEISPRLFGQYAKAYQEMLGTPLNISKLFMIDEDDNTIHVKIDYNDDSPPFGYSPYIEEDSEIEENSELP